MFNDNRRSQPDDVCGLAQSSGGTFLSGQDVLFLAHVFSPPLLLMSIFPTVDTSLNKLEEIILCRIIMCGSAMRHGRGNRVGNVRNLPEVFNLVVE